MAYVDGFVVPVPTKNLAQYRKLAKMAGKVWMEHRALEYVECEAEDMSAADFVAFPQLITAKKGETVFFSWIKYKSRAHRDAVNKKVMNDERLMQAAKTLNPFDCKRMAYGGFKTVVAL